MQLDSTHDPSLRSWVPGAGDPRSDFPVQNLPYGRFRRSGSNDDWRIGVAIGSEVLDLREAAHAVHWPTEVAALLELTSDGTLNSLMSVPSKERVALRRALSEALTAGSPHAGALSRCLVPQSMARMSLPCRIGDYTDFFTGIHHATAVGRLFRPDSPLLPNYKWVPIGYHGRASSIVVSGHPVIRPMGQTKAAEADAPVFGPTGRLDYELELGYLIGPGNGLGQPVPVSGAEDHLFGVTLLNDWSARDVQAWEYQPLGPFLAKNFATTLSPWVVTMEALAPFRAPLRRDEADPRPLPYLDSAETWTRGALDIRVEAWLQTAAMRAKGLQPERIAASEAKQAAYWTAAQLMAHHTSNGCNLQAGDLMGSGTLSGSLPGEAGSLLEQTQGGKFPLRLPSGEERNFLEDGDTLTLTASCEKPGLRRIGFGSCTGTVFPARSIPRSDHE
jgi:fumarylacetoacetase